MTWAVIRGHNARFGFTIPKGTPAALTGLPIVVKVHDGGTPGWKYDTYAHGVATSWHNGPVTQYPITSGNIVVHKLVTSPDRFTGAPPACAADAAGAVLLPPVRADKCGGAALRACRAGSATSFTAKPDGSRHSRRAPPSGLIVHGAVQGNGPWLASSPLACR